MPSLQKVTLLIVLLCIGAVLGPVSVAVLVYRDNPIGLILPPEIEDLMQGEGSAIIDDVLANNAQTNSANSPSGFGDITINYGNTSIGGFTPPQIISEEVDTEARTFRWTVNLTNPLAFDVTVKKFNTTVLCTQHKFPLGNVRTEDDIQIGGSQSAPVVLSGSWSESSENHFAVDHAGASEVDVSISGLTVEVNGITIQLNDPISLGNVPIG